MPWNVYEQHRTKLHTFCVCVCVLCLCLCSLFYNMDNIENTKAKTEKHWKSNGMRSGIRYLVGSLDSHDRQQFCRFGVAICTSHWRSFSIAIGSPGWRTKGFCFCFLETAKGGKEKDKQFKCHQLYKYKRQEVIIRDKAKLKSCVRIRFSFN